MIMAQPKRKGYKASRSVNRVVVLFAEDAGRLLALIPELQQINAQEITESMPIMHALVHCPQEWNRYGDIFAFVCPSVEYAQRLHHALDNAAIPDVTLNTIGYWDSLRDDCKEHGRERARIRREMLELKRQQADNDDADYAQSMLQAVLVAELDARRRYQPQPESSELEFWERITNPDGFWEERG